jgi:predicted phosphodiesterase
MRYAVLADVHGNLHALDAALERLRDVGVDAYLVAGDLVGYGPFPNECVERLAELGATCVAGNHDLMALGRLGDERCIPLARRSLAWTRQVLRDDVRAYLDGLPGWVAVEESVIMAHGTLDHAWEYTTRPDQATAQLARLRSEFHGAGVLLLGHTHRRWACDSAGQVLRPPADGDMLLPDPVLLNPGAVGQARELRVRARFLVLDTERHTAAFHDVRYDTAACRAALRRSGLAPGSYRLRPTLRGAGRRILRHVGRISGRASSR